MESMTSTGGAPLSSELPFTSARLASNARRRCCSRPVSATWRCWWCCSCSRSRHHAAHLRQRRDCSISRSCARSGSIATSRSRTNTGTSTTPASRRSDGFRETLLEHADRNGTPHQLRDGRLGDPVGALLRRRRCRGADGPRCRRRRAPRRLLLALPGRGVLRVRLLRVPGGAPRRRLATASRLRSAAQPVAGIAVWLGPPSSSTPTSPRSSLMPPPRSASPFF